MRKYMRMLVGVTGILSALNASGFSLGSSRMDIAVPVGGMHAPLRVDVLDLPEGVGLDGINIVSNVEWLHGDFDPSTEAIIVSVDVPEIPMAYSGQMTVQLGESSVNLAVSAVRLDAVSNIRFQAGSGPEDTLLLYRGKGAAQPFGNLIEYYGMAHAQGGASTCVTLSGNPIDFAFSSDRSLVYVIDSAKNLIQEINVSDMTLRRAFDLPVEGGTCCGELSEALIEVGGDQFVYFTDGEAYSDLHVYDLSTGSIVQSRSTGRTGFGFGDFALSADGESLIALGRVIRGSSGEFPVYLSRYQIQKDGSLVFDEDTYSDSNPKSYFYPASGPKLVAPGQVSDLFAFGNNLIRVNDLNATVLSLPRELYTLSPGGFYALSHNEIFSTKTGKKVADLPIGTPYATFLNDVHKVAIVPSNQINVQILPFVDKVIDRFLDQDRFPEHSAIVQDVSQLRWGSVPSATTYFVYASKDVDTLGQSLIGQTKDPFFDPGNVLADHGTYHWRVDTVIPSLVDGEVMDLVHLGSVQQFKVLPFGLDQGRLDVRALNGMSQQTSRLHVDAPASVDWSLKTNQDWIHLDQIQYSGTAAVEVTFVPDWSVRATQLQGEILFYHQQELVYEMPVTLFLDRLFFRRMLTVENSPYVYGLATTLFPDTKYRALLAKINTITENIDLLIDVGPHATDFEIHSQEGKLYVAHGAEGSLSVFNLQTLEYERKIMLLGSQHPDRPGHAYTYLSAGPSGFMMVEDTMGPTIMSLIATDTGRSLQVLNLKHLTGAFSPAKDTYYSAESVGLERRLKQFQFGDGALNLVKSVNRDGSNTSKGERMMISDNGQRIFWDRAVYDSDLEVLQVFKDNVFDISPDGTMAFGLSQIYDTDTGQVIKTTTGFPLGKPFPESRAYHSEMDTLVFQDQMYQLYFERIKGDPPGFPRQDEQFSMEDGISWAPVPFASQYHVYLSQDKGAIQTAQPGSGAFLGVFEGLHADVRDRVNQEGGWYWRVDAVTPFGTRQGEIMLFNVFEFSASTNLVSNTFFSGQSETGLSVAVQSTFRPYDWSVSTAFDWIRLHTTEGTGSGAIKFDLDADGLESGEHVGRILVVPDGGTPLNIEVRLTVVGFNPVKMVSHPRSKMVYGISRTGSAGFSPVVLFALDAESETVTKRISLDAGFDDFVIQADDGLLFVRNTRTGLVWGLDLESFERVMQFSFMSSGGRSELALMHHGPKGHLILQLMSPASRTVLFSISKGKAVEEIVSQAVDGVVSEDGLVYYMIRESSRKYYLQKFHWIDGSYKLVKEAEVIRFQSSVKNHITASSDGQFVYWAGGVYNAELGLVHETGEEIFSATDNGRFAISANSVFDTSAKSMMYRLPFSSQVSVFNALTRKLLIPGNERISGYVIEDPAQIMHAPELVQVDVLATAALLMWDDRSLENEFVVLYRSLDEESEWIEYGRTGPNANQQDVRGLKSGASYAFKVQAVDGLQNVYESNEVAVKTLYTVPRPPRWSQPDTSWDKVILRWSGDYQRDDEIVLERKRRDEPDWTPLAVLPPDAREYVDRDLFSGYYYDYRIAAKNPGGMSSWSQVIFAYVPYFLYFENGGFENDTLSGWVVQDLPNPQLPVSFRHEGYSPLRGFFQTEPTEGHHVLIHGLGGADEGSIRISQEILIPDQGAILAFDYRAAWTAIPSNAVRVWDVSIENPDTNEVLEIYPLIIATSNNSNLDTGNKTERVDVSKYAGESIRVSFGIEIEGANEGFGMIQLDHVRLEVEVSYALSVTHDPENGFAITVKDPPLGRLVLEQSTDFKNWTPVLTGNVYENTGAIVFNDEVESELGQPYQFYRVRNE